MAMAHNRLHTRDSLWSWRQIVLRSELTPATRQVLLTLAHHMRDGDPGCFTAPRNLVVETGLAMEAVGEAPREAVDAGLIEVKAAAGRHLGVIRTMPGERCE